MKEEKITNEDLARMVAKGFSSIENRMATKEDLQEVKDELYEVKGDLHNVKEDVHEVKKDIREINMKIHDVDEYSRRHSRRIEKLEENAGIL